MADITTGLIRRYTMNGIVGTNVPEMVGGNDGTIVGSGSSIINGPPTLGGSALRRSASGDYVTLGAFNIDPLTTDMVIAWWYLSGPTTTNVIYPIASRTTVPGEGGLTILNNGTAINPYIGNDVQQGSSPSHMHDQVWSHHVVSVEAGVILRHFSNGVTGPTDVTPGSAADATDPYQLFQRPGAGATGVLALADVRVYEGRTFALADAAALYALVGSDAAKTVKNTITPTVIPTVIPTA